MIMLVHTIHEPAGPFPALEAVAATRPVVPFTLLDRGAVTVEKALLMAVVIFLGWLGIRLVGDPLRDPVFRVIFGILVRIYELIVTMLGGVR